MDEKPHKRTVQQPQVSGAWDAKESTGDQGHFIPLDVDVFATLAIILEEVHGYDGLGRAATNQDLLPDSAEGEVFSIRAHPRPGHIWTSPAAR